MKKVALVILISRVISVGIVASGKKARYDSQDGGAVKVQMHNVMYHFTDQIAVHLINVGGKLVPTRPATYQFLTTRILSSYRSPPRK